MASGIYKIVNKINGKFYIGSSLNLSRRKAEHKYKRTQSIGNSAIRSAVKKYGEANLVFEVLEVFTFGNWASRGYKLELLTSREQFYVDSLNPPYNIRRDVTSNKGVVSDAMLAHIKNLSTRDRSHDAPRKVPKRILVYNSDNELVDTCESTQDAIAKYQLDKSNVTRSCNGQRGISGRCSIPYNFKYEI